MQERLAAGEIDVAHSECRGGGDRLPHCIQCHEIEGRLVRAAAVEAVMALDVAARPADLDPEVVEVTQVDGRRSDDCVHLKYRVYVVRSMLETLHETHSVVASAGAPPRGRRIPRAHRTRTAASVAARPRGEMAPRGAPYRIRRRRGGDGQSARTTCR